PNNSAIDFHYNKMHIALPNHQFYRFTFFFQAEDGIRDGHVTGVQTCALPIWKPRLRVPLPMRLSMIASSAPNAPPQMKRTFAVRSEERRVGKECRSWMGE